MVEERVLETAVQCSVSQEIVHRGRNYLDKDQVLRQRRKYWNLKRGQDVLFSLIALLLLAPVMLLIMLLIVIDDPSASPIFTQVRVGRHGKKFKFYKFRTMCPGAEEQLEGLMKLNEMDGPVFKIRNDPRITRVGRILRKTSLDELPQFLNVLLGDMSIVGPRPAIPREVELYDDYERQRLFVTPGLTCYWQIQPNRNDMSFEEWLELDLKYIRERNYFIDWKIMLKTIRAVLKMDGV